MPERLGLRGVFAFQLTQQGGRSHAVARLEQVFGMIGDVILWRREPGRFGIQRSRAGIGTRMAAEDVRDVQPPGFRAIGGQGDPDRNP